MAIYEKPVRLLFKDMVEDLGTTENDIITRDKVYSWFKDKYPKIKDATISAHLLKMSTNAPSRIHYNVNPNGDDDLFYQLDSRRYRLYKSIDDPEPIYKKAPEGDGIDGPEGEPVHASDLPMKETSNISSQRIFPNYI